MVGIDSSSILLLFDEADWVLQIVKELGSTVVVGSVE